MSPITSMQSTGAHHQREHGASKRAARIDFWRMAFTLRLTRRGEDKKIVDVGADVARDARAQEAPDSLAARWSWLIFLSHLGEDSLASHAVESAL